MTNGWHSAVPLIQNSEFGEISFTSSSGISGTLGLRYFSYSSSVVTDDSGLLSSTGSDLVAHSVASEADHGLNPEVDLSYKWDGGLLIYATAAKGFRPGGGNQPIPNGGGAVGDACEAALQANHGTHSFVPAPTGFKPDSLWITK